MPGTVVFEPQNPEPVPNVISAIEDFFQEPVSFKLSRVIEEMPANQFYELWNRCTPLGMAAGSVARMRAWSKEPFTETQGYFSQLETGSIAVSDALLAAGTHTAVASTPGIKQAALYTERTLIRDSLCAPLSPNESEHRMTFAHRLRQVLPLAQLIRSGIFVPVSADLTDTVEPNWVYLSTLRVDPFISSLKTANPVAAQHIKAIYGRLMSATTPQPEESDGELLDGWISPPVDLEGYMGELAAVLVQAYPRPITTAKLREVLLQSHRIQRGNFSAITSDADLSYHLRLCAQLSVDPQLRLVPSEPPHDLAPAVEYQVPAIQASLETIAKLRQQEEIFQELHVAFAALGQACAADSQQYDSAEAYEHLVGRYAQEIVQPVYERLLAWSHRARLKRWGGQLFGSGLGMGLDLTTLPGARAIGKSTGRLISKKSERTEQDTALAAQILQSFL